MNKNIPNVPDYEKTWAVITHLSMIPVFFIPFVNIFVPFILRLVHRNGSEFIQRHTSAALSLGVTLTLSAFFFVYMGLFVMSPFSDETVGHLLSKTDLYIDYKIYFTPIIDRILQKIFLWTVVVFPVMWFLGIVKGAYNANRGKPFHYPFTFFLFRY